MSLIFVARKYKRINFIIVNYGNFIDILALPLLKLSFKQVHVIVHVGESWQHIKNKALKNITNFILETFVKKVYIISETQRKFLYHNRIEKIHTIINKQFLKKPKFITHETEYLLFLGRICMDKGIEDIIAVYSELNKTIDLPYLKLVGPIDESYKKHLVRILKMYKIHNRVTILPPISDTNKKIELIDNALILVYPSHKDAFPLTIVEAVSRGIYVLATSISETTNFIEFDEFLFEAGNRNELRKKLVNLISSKNSLKNKSAYLQTKALRFANGNIVKEIFK